MLPDHQKMSFVLCSNAHFHLAEIRANTPNHQRRNTQAEDGFPIAKYQRSVSPSEHKKHPIYQQLALGGFSCAIATTFTHPIDTVKLRIQLQGSLSGTEHRYHGLVSGLHRVARDEGMFALYNGLSPAILRAATYSASRLGLYEPLRMFLTETLGNDQPTFGTKVAAAVSSGSIGAFVGNPCELIKVRMQQADIYQYKHVGDGIVRITREEGFTALWNGTMPAALRAALLTSSQLATYDHCKTLLKKYTGMEEGLKAHFGAAMTAGLVTTSVSTPADVVKSVVMHSKPRMSPMECARLIFRTEGMRGFLRGWTANYARLGPHTLITVLTYENLRTALGWNNL
ncbi:unnamed protein product [Agarophyton chilense]